MEALLLRVSERCECVLMINSIYDLAALNGNVKGVSGKFISA